MKYVLAIALSLFLVVPATANHAPQPAFQIQAASNYVGRVKLNSGLSIRILILKHTYEQNAENEQRGIIKAANLAASKGLSIRDIGGHHVDGNGHRVSWQNVAFNDLKGFISEQMRVSAIVGDTLIIYTTGHGSSGGYMAQFGYRKKIGKIFASAAAENEQETLWWQSSCYAAAGLPIISSMSEREKEYFSMIASSTENRLTYWGDQTPRMRKVFVAMAEKDPAIDPNGDSVVTAGELRDFLNNKVKRGAGDLVFASNPDEPIFGLDWANSIPIIDRPSGKLFEPDRKYIPHPRR